MNAVRVLVTGATGRLGPYLGRAASRLGQVVAVSRGNESMGCDLTRPHVVQRMLRDVAPAIVIHAAGWTDVDGCEANPVLAHLTNCSSISNIVASLTPSVRLVFISTDQVYPNDRGPHVEGTEAPVNVYGKTKLAGELAALSHPRTLVLRVNFFGPSGAADRPSISDFVTDKLSNREPVTFFEDVKFSPLHMTTLADLVLDAIDEELTGVFNVGSRDGMSKRDFAFAVARHLNLPTDTAQTGRSTDYPARARRPLDLRMDVTKFETHLGKAMPTLREEIRKL